MDFKLTFQCDSIEQVRGTVANQPLYNFSLSAVDGDPLNTTFWPGSADGEITLTDANPNAFKVGNHYTIGFYG